MVPVINNTGEYLKALEENPACLFYFSHENCNVCKTLKPKTENLIQEKFPKISLFYVNIVKNPGISGKTGIFAAPTLVLYLQGKESLRKSRNFSLQEFEQELDRLYSIFFN